MASNVEILKDLTEIHIKGGKVCFINKDIEKTVLEKAELDKKILFLIKDLEKELKKYDNE